MICGKMKKEITKKKEKKRNKVSNLQIARNQEKSKETHTHTHVKQHEIN